MVWSEREGGMGWGVHSERAEQCGGTYKRGLGFLKRVGRRMKEGRQRKLQITTYY